jgi:hypothetical protein
MQLRQTDLAPGISRRGEPGQKQLPSQSPFLPAKYGP